LTTDEEERRSFKRSDKDGNGGLDGGDSSSSFNTLENRPTHLSIPCFLLCRNLRTDAGRRLLLLFNLNSLGS